MRIRAASLKDLEEICRIENSSFSDPWTENMLAEELKNPKMKCFVAEDSGKLLAYVLTLYIEPFEATICSIAVEPESRRKGVARELMQAAINTAESLKIADITLEVRVSNNSAIELYKSFDFVSEGLRKAYYEDGEDAEIMWRRK